jgi:alanyl-tRNA synthetase
MTHQDIRKKYIEFFKKNRHKEIPAASLIPENDPTTLFTSSGMQPLIPYLLGETHPLGNRLVDSQKSFRSQDIEEVGDNRHTTFFEMLGNWSLGDYFKKEQLPWFFEFLTKELKLPQEKLAVTCFEGNEFVPKDTESFEIWKSLGISEKRIFFYNAKKNWWSRSGVPDAMPAGEPGGPDSEVFFEFTEIPHDKKFGETCHPNCDCGRFMEIGNSVFMQYQKQEDGSLKELSQKNVDFGGGLERLVAASSNNPDVFMSSSFSTIIKKIEEISETAYSENKKSMRIIADHIKAATFLVAEGLVPSNKAQGYVLRRLLRRAAVKLFLMKKDALHKLPTLMPGIVNLYADTSYFASKPETKVVEDEILRFEKSLEKGLKEVERIKTIDGKLAFDLYQSFGFPLEITRELFVEKGQDIDDQEFKMEFKKHQSLSRTSSKGMFKGGLQDQSDKTTKLHTATHLLQQSLRTILGDHVRQKGSHITAERLRFDFINDQKLSPDQIKQIEDLVNSKITENLSVSMTMMSLSEAVEKKALTVPGATYPEKVKVYSMGSFSKEVCGGPHVDFTGSLGSFKIIKEEGVSAGVRRIYATLS